MNKLVSGLIGVLCIVGMLWLLFFTEPGLLLIKIMLVLAALWFLKWIGIVSMFGVFMQRSKK